MSKLFISLLFLFVIIYTIVICSFYLYEYNKRIEYQRESIDKEKEIELQRLQIANLKRQLAKLKKSLYNDDKEDKRWKK